MVPGAVTEVYGPLKCRDWVREVRISQAVEA